PDGGHHEEGDHHREHVDEGDKLDVDVDLPLPALAGDANACHDASALSVAPRPAEPRTEGESEKDQSARFSSGCDGIFILSRLATTRLSRPTEVSLMSSIMACVRPCRMAKQSRPVMATIRPNPVQFITCEIPVESSVALSAGFAAATPPNTVMRP